MVVKDHLLIGGKPKKMQRGKMFSYKGWLIEPIFWFAADMIHIVSWELAINQQIITDMTVAELERVFQLTVKDIHEINKLVLLSDL